MKPNWSKSPSWATHWLELEGGRSVWSDKFYDNLSFQWREDLPLLSSDKDDFESFFSLSVLQCIPRPEWKTLIHFKDNGKLTTYEAEGQLTHAAVKRQLVTELGVDSRVRVMVEYKQLN